MKPTSDAFTTHFFRRLDPDVLAGLSPSQRDAITDALRAGVREHAVDLRWTMNLLFKRVYVVILAGRDLRRHSAEASQRAHADTRKNLTSLFLLSAFLAPALLVLALLLYGIKCLLGIDIFESRHLMDFFN